MTAMLSFENINVAIAGAPVGTQVEWSIPVVLLHRDVSHGWLHKFGVVVDPSNVIDEFDEENNAGYIAKVHVD